MDFVSAGGADIPSLGLGTYRLSGGTCRRAVETALEAGYRHVDTAEYYDNERAVGEAITASSVDREDVFLTTKVWRSHLQADDVRTAAEASLERLGVEYVDLLLIHWPNPRVPVGETLEAMATLREEGAVRHIGVSNFTREQLAEAIDATEVPIVTDQVLYHPYKDQTQLLEYCSNNDLALTAYSPLARGAVLDDDTLRTIGERYGKSAAQVTIRWLFQQDSVVAIPRSSSPEHIRANADVFDFELTDDEMATIDDLSGGFSVRLQDFLPTFMRSIPF